MCGVQGGCRSGRCDVLYGKERRQWLIREELVFGHFFSCCQGPCYLVFPSAFQLFLAGSLLKGPRQGLFPLPLASASFPGEAECGRVVAVLGAALGGVLLPSCLRFCLPAPLKLLWPRLGPGGRLPVKSGVHVQLHRQKCERFSVMYQHQLARPWPWPEAWAKVTLGSRSPCSVCHHQSPSIPFPSAQFYLLLWNCQPCTPNPVLIPEELS